ncbi:MAG: fumarylacetoacetate hydrolase family protein [Pseudolabrys sp.]|nr:fumarylacetoacetate hydrolase family protein [Pseudolabrys sp.]
MNPWDDPRIAKGMAAQLAKRRERIAAGEKPLGWKVGLGAPAAMERLGTKGPGVGYLMQRGLLLTGATIAFAGWTKPVAECEIAVRMARDLPGGATAADARAAVKEILPAIEVADFDPPPTADNLDHVLANNIYARHVVLAGITRPGASVEGLTSQLIRRGAEAASTQDPEALTGKLDAIVAHVANTLAAYGEKLSAGDVIITGSITPPIMLEKDETELAHVLDPIGAVGVKFDWS